MAVSGGMNGVGGFQTENLDVSREVCSPQHRAARYRHGTVGVEGAGPWLLRPEWVFLILFLSLALFSALTLPAGAGADEPSHIERVWSLSEGEILPAKVGTASNPDHQKWGGYVPDGLDSQLIKNMASYVQQPHAYSFPVWRDSSVENKPVNPSGPQQLVPYSNSAVNSPVAYAPQILSTALLRPLLTTPERLALQMRVVGIVFAAATLFFCIRFIPVGKWLLTALMVLPMAVFPQSSVTADVMTNCVAISFTTAVLLALSRGRVTRANRVWLIVLALALAQIKVTYLPMIVLLALLPIAIPEERSKKRLWGWGVVVLVACILFLLWYARIRMINTDTMFGSTALPHEQMRYALTHKRSFVGAVLLGFARCGTLPLGGSEPMRLYCPGWLCAMVLFAAALLDEPRESVSVLRKRKGIITVFFWGAFLIIFALILVAEYLQFTRVGGNVIQGVQTRYFAAVNPLIFLPLLLLMKQGSAVRESESMTTTAVCHSSYRSAAILLVACMAVLTAIALITLLSGVYIAPVSTGAH